MQERWVQFLGWEDSLGGGKSNPLQFSCLGNLTYRGASWTAVCGLKESQILLSTYKHTHTQTHTQLAYNISGVQQSDVIFSYITPRLFQYYWLCSLCCILYSQCEGKMCMSCSELCLQVIWITSLVISLRTVHRVILHPLEEDMDLANWHALPQNTDLFCFCKMVIYRASQHLAWNITSTINYIDIYTWSAGDIPFNCLFLHEFHGVSIHVLIQIFIS